MLAKALLAGMLLVSALLNGCSQRESPIEQSEWEKLIAIRGEASDIHYQKMLKDLVLHSGGQSATNQDSSAISSPDASPLYTKSNLLLLQKIEDSYAADSDDELKVRRLRDYLIELHYQDATAEAYRYISEMNSADLVKLDNRSVPLAQIPHLISGSENRDFRQQAFYAQLPALRKENAIRLEIIRIQDSIAVETGYGDFASFMQESQQQDYSTLAMQATQFISQTDLLYHRLASTVVPKLIGLKSEMLKGYDIPFLMAALTELSPSESLLINAPDYTKRLGVEVDKSVVEMVFSPQASDSRAATYPISIPDLIKIVVPATNNRAEPHVVLHELGHALHYQFTTEREFEFTQLGAGALREAYAFLIESLPETEIITQSIPGGSSQSGRLQRRALLQLMTARSYCADFLFELETYAGIEAPRDIYSRIKEPIVGYPFGEIDRELAFRHLDNFESADYLTGWFLAAHLQEKLRIQFGDRWFESTDAGNFLKDLWKSGTRKSASNVAAAIGLAQITPDALIRQLTQLAN